MFDTVYPHGCCGASFEKLTRVMRNRFKTRDVENKTETLKKDLIICSVWEEKGQTGEAHLVSLVLQRELLLLQMQRQLLHAALQPAVHLLLLALLSERRQRTERQRRRSESGVCVCVCVLTSPLPAASPPAPAGAAAVWRPRRPDRLAEIPPAATRVRADPYSTGRQTTLLSVVPLNLRKRVQHVV